MLVGLPLQNGELLRTPYNDCKALNPKNGAPFFVLGPNMRPHVNALATHPCINPGINKCNPPSNFSFSDLPESCSYEGRVLQDGEDWPLSSCAKCMCRNGVTQCFAAQCPPLFCNKVSETASGWVLPRLLTSLCGTWSPFGDYARPPRKFRNKEPRQFCFPYPFGDHC